MHPNKTHYRFALWLALINLFAVAPLYENVAAKRLSEMLSCPAPDRPEDYVVECVVLGADWGPTLQLMAGSDILFALTGIIGGVVFFLWLVALCAYLFEAARLAETENTRPGGVSPVKFWMVAFLAAITALVALPGYISIMMLFFSSEPGGFLYAILDSLGDVIKFLTPIVLVFLIGWVFLGLVLWLTYSALRLVRRTRSRP